MIIKFNPAGPRRDGVRPQEGSSDEAEPWTRVNPPRPPSTASSVSRPTSHGTPQGNIFISDGYINSRVAKFDKNGDWVKSLRRAAATGPASSTRRTASPRTRSGNIYVADRGNRRIQVFDPRRRLSARDQASTCRCRRMPIRRSAIARAPTTAGTQSPARRGPSASRPARIRCCTRPTRSRAGSTRCRSTGRFSACWARPGKQPKQFGWIHEIACPSENELYVAEILNWRVQKLLLHPRPAGTQ